MQPDSGIVEAMHQCTIVDLQLLPNEDHITGINTELFQHGKRLAIARFG